MRGRWNRWRLGCRSGLVFVAGFEPSTRLVAAGPAPEWIARGHGYFVGTGF